MTEYSSSGGPGRIAFAAKVPGSILQIDVAATQTYLIHRHGFLCATEGIKLSTGFQRSLGAGIFGGNGFIMQKVEGPCSAWVELGGEAVVYDLKPGETLRVHPGHDWFTVLSGTARLQLGERTILVETGDAAEFSTMVPHAIGPHGGPVEILAILDPAGDRAHIQALQI